MDAAGGDALVLLSDAGINAKALSEPESLISYRAFGNLLEIASEELSRPAIGLDWTLRTPPHFPNLGPLALLANFTSTMQEWVDASIEYWRYHTNAFTLQQFADDTTGQIAMRYMTEEIPFPTRQLTEMVLANSYGVARNVIGSLVPTVVRFQHRKPIDVSNHELAFRCPVEFSAEHNEIVFDPKFLKHPTNGNLKLLKPLLGYYIKSRIQLMPRYDQSMKATVEHAIQSVIGSGQCNILFISGSLGLAPKKLQRMLAAENTSFSDILETVRRTTAQTYLSQTEAPVGRIAGLLDYSTTAPFTLAFRRWTGQSPLEFRRTVRE